MKPFMTINSSELVSEFHFPLKLFLTEKCISFLQNCEIFSFCFHENSSRKVEEIKFASTEWSALLHTQSKVNISSLNNPTHLIFRKL